METQVLKTLLRFTGFSPPAPPPRPPSARRVAPSPKPAVAPVAPPPAPVVPIEDPLADKRAQARELSERQGNRRFAEAVGTLQNVADPNVRWVDPQDVSRAQSVLPQSVQAYLRVRRLAGLRTRILGEADRDNPRMTAAYRAGLIRLAETDFETWTQGLAAHDRAVAGATSRGEDLPLPIEVPSAVEDGIAKLAVEKVRRINEAAARRAGGGGAGGGTPAGTPPGTPPVVPLAGPKKSEDDEEPTPDAPAGPRR